MKKVLALIFIMTMSTFTQAADKWANQCAYTGKITTIYDDTGASKIALLNSGAYYVTHTKEKMAGLSVETGRFDPKTEGPEKRFVGWVKKADMKLVDYRNCSF